MIIFAVYLEREWRMVQGVNLEINYEDGNNERGWNSPFAIGGTVLPTLISPNSWPGGDGWEPR